MPQEPRSLVQRQFSDTYGIVTASPRTAFPARSCGQDIGGRAPAGIPDVSKIDMLSVQDEAHHQFSTSQIRQAGLDKTALIAALRAQNAIAPAAW